MSDDDEFKINDAVQIEQKSSPPLEGVIAFLGPVSFAEGNDWVGIRLTGGSVGKGKNDGTVKGIKYFDHCKPNGGMFVKESVLKKRALSRLEELRLKRELKGTSTVSFASPRVKSKSGAGGTNSGSSRRLLNASNSGDSSGGGIIADDDTSVSSLTSMRSSATSATNRSRLDEIRSRRLALQQRKITESSPAASSKKALVTPRGRATGAAGAVSTPGTGGGGTNTTTPTSARSMISTTATPASRRRQQQQMTPSMPTAPSSSPTTAILPSSNVGSPTKTEIENSHLKTKIEILTSKLQQSEIETTSLQSELQSVQTRFDASTKETHELKLEMNELKSSLEEQQKEYQEKLSSALTAAAVASTKGATNQNEQMIEIQQLQNQIESLQESNITLQKESKDENERIQLKYQVQITSIQESFDQELNQKEQELSSIQKQLSAYEGKISLLEKNITENVEKAALREDHDSEHYKERAKLQAEILSWSRKVQDVSKEKLELEVTLEELVLDKESLQEKCEEMEDLLDEYKIDAESAQIEVDELRLELESARERAEKAESAVTLMNAGGGTGGTGDGSTATANTNAEDVAQALSIQNARLREAIIRLREQTAFEKMESTKQLRNAEKESGAIQGLKDEIANFLTNEKKLKLEVNELKEMVDQGSAFEKMVEEMSDRVLEVEDNNIALQSDIRALEEAAELSAEMEEVQADEIKVLMKELQVRDTVVFNLEEAIKM